MLHHRSVWRFYEKKCYLMLLCTLLAIFVVFHPKICVFVILISFFDKVSNFRNRILTNQKRELVWGGFQVSAELHDIYQHKVMLVRRKIF